MTLAQDAREAFGNNLATTGHSLGGGLASAAALAIGCPSVVFNPAGLSDQTLRDLGFSPNQARAIASDGLIRLYATQYDLLTNLQQNILPSVGTEIRISNTTLNPVRAHLITGMIQGLESGKVIPIKLTVDPVGRVGEAIFDVCTYFARQGGGLVNDIVGVGKQLVQNVGRDLSGGRPLAAPGNIVSASLQTTSNIAKRGFNVVSNLAEAGGNLVGGLFRDAGTLVRLPGTGNAVGIWLETQTQRAGNLLFTAGSKIKSGLDTVSSWVKSQI